MRSESYVAYEQAAVGRLGAGKTFEPEPDPKHKVSSFYQDRAGDPSTVASEAMLAQADNPLKKSS
jgi:hypothetical protein